jgi:hypothetical protein
MDRINPNYIYNSVALVRNEQYRPNDRSLSAKLVQTFMDRVCRVVSAADPSSHNFCFLDRTPNYIYILENLFKRNPISGIMFYSCQLCSSSSTQSCMQKMRSRAKLGTGSPTHIGIPAHWNSQLLIASLLVWEGVVSHLGFLPLALYWWYRDRRTFYRIFRKVEKRSKYSNI